MKRYLVAIAAVVGSAMLLALSAGVALAERRVALVIGNSTYQRVAKLLKPVRDATAVAKMFKDAGFDRVELLLDLANQEFKRAIYRFEDDVVPGSDIAVIYFAGHGIEIDGTNYMIPVDAELSTAEKAITLNRIVEAVDTAKRLRLVIIDACRDDPFRRQRTSAQRTVSRCLGSFKPNNTETLIAYSAVEGTTVDDGKDLHSPYTKALLDNLTTPGLDIRLAFARVRDQVMSVTNKKQEPNVIGSLAGGLTSLVPPAAEPKVPDEADIKADYERVENLGTLVEKLGTLRALGQALRAWEIFLSTYPNGSYADRAREQMAKLKAADAERQRLAEIERQKAAEAERQRLAEAERQRLAEAERQQKAAEAERQRLAEIEQQKAAEVERQRLAEIERQKAAEAERQRLAEIEQQKAAEVERQRLAEIERQKAAEAERQRLAEIEQQKAAEVERQRLAEIERQKAAEAERQKAAEAERQRLAEIEQQKAAEVERQRLAEIERQKAAEAERQKAAEAERQKAAEAERQKAAEAERQRLAEIEQQKAAEVERQRLAEIERQKAAEAEWQKAAEAERQKAAEAERQRLAEIERQKAAEAERRRLAEIERQKAAEAERQKAAEAERQRLAEIEQQKAAEVERQRLAEIERQKAAEAERQRLAEIEQQRAAEAERQRLAEIERQKAAEAERQRLAEIEQQKATEAEQQRLAEIEAERQRTAEVERQRLAEIERLRLAEIERKVELIVSAQEELRRLGCYFGEVDGTLSDATKTAILGYLFKKRRSTRSIDVTEGFVSDLSKQRSRVCPLECPPGQTAKGETCVANEQTPKVKQAVRSRDEDGPPRKVRREEPRSNRTASRPQPGARQEPGRPQATRRAEGTGSRGGTMTGVGF